MASLALAIRGRAGVWAMRVLQTRGYASDSSESMDSGAGSIREAGGAFGRREKAEEERYFRIPRPVKPLCLNKVETFNIRTSQLALHQPQTGLQDSAQGASPNVSLAIIFLAHGHPLRTPGSARPPRRFERCLHPTNRPERADPLSLSHSPFFSPQPPPVHPLVF